MTRINVVPVTELCDKHLLAEYRELPRVFRLARPCLDAPKEYVLGPGHVKFFYDKLGFLGIRLAQIINELNERGFKATYQELPDWVEETSSTLWNDYEPTPKALAINLSRIAERVSQFERTGNKECSNVNG